MAKMQLVGGTRDGMSWDDAPADITSINIPVRGAHAYETWIPDHETGLAAFAGRTEYSKPVE